MFEYCLLERNKANLGEAIHIRNNFLDSLINSNQTALECIKIKDQAVLSNLICILCLFSHYYCYYKTILTVGQCYLQAWEWVCGYILHSLFRWFKLLPFPYSGLLSLNALAKHFLGVKSYLWLEVLGLCIIYFKIDDNTKIVQ